MEKKQFISEEERVKCLKVIDAYAELYEETDDDIVVLDGGKYGFIKLQHYNYPDGFNTSMTFTDGMALFDDCWEDWLNMQLFHIAKGTPLEELDYEDIFFEDPGGNKADIDGKESVLCREGGNH